MKTEETAKANDKERALTTYQVAGNDIKLSYNIVRNFLTKGNGEVTDQDMTQFISICKYNQLNPFLNEAYLIKFGNQPATMVVSKEALFKRAEANPAYKGIQAGVIVIRNKEQVELEGCFYLPGDKLAGGWAKVYRSDRDHPYVSRVTMEEYNKNQSSWKEKPSTMISKVAKVQALREAFMTQLGAMYTAEEQGLTIDIEGETVIESKETLSEKLETVNKKKEEIKEKKPEKTDGNNTSAQPNLL